MIRSFSICLILVLVSGCSFLNIGAPLTANNFTFPEPLGREEAWFLVNICSLACQHEQDVRLSEKSQGRFQSLWNEHAMAFNKGVRTRLCVDFVLDEDDQVTGIDYYMECQKIKAMERALNPEPGDWKPAGHGREFEVRFLQHVKIRVDQTQAGPGEQPARRD